MIKYETYGFGGQAQYYIRNHFKTVGALSQINKECLTKRANEIVVKLLQGENTSSENDYFSKFINNYTNQEPANKTYGSGIVNKAVDFVSKKVLGNSALSPAKSISITPLVLPYLSGFSSVAGGIALPAAIGLITALYSRLLATGEYDLESLPPADDLIRYDRDKKAFIDVMGEVLSEKDLIELGIMIQEFDLISKLLASNKEDVGSVLLNAVNFDSKEFNSLSNDQILALGREFDEMKDAMKRNDPLDTSKIILPSLEKFVRYSICPINLTRIENEQTLHLIKKEIDVILNRLPISKESTLYFDDASKSFFVPSHPVSAWWHYQAQETIADKVSKFLRPEIEAHCDKINDMLDKLTTISKEEKAAIYSKLDCIKISLDSLTEKFTTFKINALTHASIHPNIFFVGRVDVMKKKLRLKLNKA